LDSTSESDATPPKASSHVRPKPTTSKQSAGLKQTKSAVSKTKAKLPNVKNESSPSESTANIPATIVLTSDLNSLPEFARAAWSTAFLPTLYKRLACSPDPFVIDSDLVKAIQEVVNIVYPDSIYHVRFNNKIFTLVSCFFFGTLQITHDLY
jgi:hypothetical protein